VEFCKLYGAHRVKLSLYGKYLYMMLSILFFMLDLEHCVEHVYLGLSQNVYNTSKKFKPFISFTSRMCYYCNKRDAVNILHNICDKSSLIECELVAYALDQIVYHTLHE